MQAKSDGVVVRREDRLMFNTKSAHLRGDTAAKGKVQCTYNKVLTDPREPRHAIGQPREIYIGSEVIKHQGNLGVDGHTIQ